MSEILSTIMATPLYVELLKAFMAVIGVLLIELIKVIASSIYKKKHGCKLDKKKLEYVFIFGSFVVCFGLVVLYTYFFDFINWATTCEEAGIYAACSQFVYAVIQSPRKIYEACKNSAKLHAFVVKLFTKKATKKDVQDVAKELTAIEKFYKETEM